MITRSAPALAVLALALSGCAGGGAPSRPASASQARGSSIVVVPEMMAAQGLEGVIGQEAAVLAQRFGTPRLDVAEGDARKLQFSGQSCVLDIYLYPLRPDTPPVASHVEARQRQGGAAVDRGACIREVERR